MACFKILARFFLPLFATAVLAETQVSLPVPSVLRDDQGVVTLASPTPGSVVLYTLDGEDPINKSNPYLAPIGLASGGRLKARAFTADRKMMSAVAESTFAPLAGHAPLPSTVVPVTQDRSWPSYDWAKRHETLTAMIQKQKPDILFIGDSITHFFGGTQIDLPLRGKNTWDEFYALRNAGNIGYGWDKTENVLWRLTHGEIDNIAPKVVVVMIGTNNTPTMEAPEIVAGITAICRTLHERLPDAKILLLGIFPRGDPTDLKRTKIALINAEIAKLDGQGNVNFLDISKVFLQADHTISKEIMPDKLHPNEKGYRLWAEAMEPTLVKLLGSGN